MKVDSEVQTALVRVNIVRYLFTTLLGGYYLYSFKKTTQTLLSAT